MNVELLLKVKDQILKEPRQFVMESWFRLSIRDIPNCGTAACIGGWGIAIEFNENPKMARRRMIEKSLVPYDLLGLNQQQGLRLFPR